MTEKRHVASSPSDASRLPNRRFVFLGWAVSVAVSVALLAFFLGPTQTPSELYPAYPVFESFEEMAKASNLVAIINIGEVVDRQLDYGALPGEDHRKTGGGAVPVEFVHAEVLEVLYGENRYDTVRVLALDHAAYMVHGESPLEAGDRVLAFLVEVTQDRAVGLKISEPTFAVLSGDFGTFDLIDVDTVQARSMAAPLLNGDPVDQEDELPIAFELRDIEEAIVNDG